MASIFGITAAELGAKVQPRTGGKGFAIGAGKDLEDAAALALIEDAEAMVVSYLRPSYQRLLTRVAGEIVVAEARGGETVLQASLVPFTATPKVFVNFPRWLAWGSRGPSEELPAADYTADLAAGTVTLATALTKGDRVFLDYAHGAAPTLLALRSCALTLAAVELSRRFAYFQTTDGADRFEGWQASAAGFLRDLAKPGHVALEKFERLELVEETGAARKLGSL